MATASNRGPSGDRPKAMKFDRFAGEVIEALRNDEAKGFDGKSMARVKQVLGILEDEMRLLSTAELIPTPEFVERFLTKWGGSTRHGSVVAILGVLGAIATAAVTWRRCEPSTHDVRPIPIPPHWDEDHPSFLGPLTGRTASGPSRTGEEFARLVAHLKHPERSGPFEGARLFLLVACVALGDLSPSEALALEFDDFGPGPDGPALTIASREGIRNPRAQAVVDIPGTLVDLRDRMEPRAHGRWLMPDLHRSGPWSYYGPGKLAGMATVALKKACDDAELPAFTFEEVARLGAECDAGSLFAIARSDGVMTLNPLDIADLEVVVYDSFKDSLTGKGPSKGTVCELKRAFRFLRKAGIARSTGLGVPDLGDRIIAATGPDDPQMNEKVLKWANAICNIAIKKGHLDLAPLSGHRKPPRYTRPSGPRPHRRLLGSIVIPRETSPAELATLAVRRCPVSQRPLEPPVNPGESLPVQPSGKCIPAQWRGTREELDQEIDAIQSFAYRESIRALIQASLDSPPHRLTKRQLAEQSGMADAANHLRDLAATGCRLGKAIDFAGRGSRRGTGISIDLVNDVDI